MKYDGKSKRLKPQDPSKDYADVLLRSCGHWDFLPLRAVIETPTLRADGSTLQTPGYDPETFLYYIPSIEFPLVAEKASSKERVGG